MAAFAFGIAAGAYHLPGPPVSIDQWAADAKLGSEAVDELKSCGARFIHVAGRQSIVDITGAALGKLLAETGVEASDIDLLVFAHTLSTSVPPAPESLPLELKWRFGLKKARCFSIAQLNCASLMATMLIINRLMLSEPGLGRAIVVSADITYGAEHRSLLNKTIQSDAASAALLTRECRRNRVGTVVVENLGQFYSGFSDTGQAPQTLAKFYQMSQLRTVKLIEQATRLAGVPFETYDRLVPANTNLNAWPTIAKVLRRSPDFVWTNNIGRIGHTCCSDTVINLVDGNFLDIPAGRGLIAAARGSTGSHAVMTLHGPETASS